MTEEHQHIVTKFDINLSQLRNEVSQMGASALDSLDPPTKLNVEGGWPAALNTPQRANQEAEQVANND